MFIMVAGCAPSSVVQVNTAVPKATAGTPAPNGQINVPGVRIQLYAPGPKSNGRYTGWAWSARQYLAGILAWDHFSSDHRTIVPS